MISIRKYLDLLGNYQSGSDAEPHLLTSGEDPLCSLCSAVLEHVARYVLAGDAWTEARAHLGGLRDSLYIGLLPDESALIQEAVRRILASHLASVQSGATRTAVEMRHLAHLLNEAVMLVANDQERSIAGLKKIHDALLQTSRIPDLITLRASLAETIRLAEDESARQQAESARALATIQTNITEARHLVKQNPNQRLQGRPEGMRDISDTLPTVTQGHALYVVAFVFERLNAVAQRYGPDAVEDVIFRLIRERIQPLAQANSAYRWTQQSVVGVFERPRDLVRVRSEAAALNQAPLVQRIPLGNRTAVLTLKPSHLIAEGRTGMAEALIEEVDRFTCAYD
jgi:hypothetical protein